jgi:hypothetical protein
MGTNSPDVPPGGDAPAAQDDGSEKMFGLDRGRLDVVA